MATYTENYNLKKPTYAESANVMVINENMDKVDDIMHSSQVSLADAYDLNSTYNTGDKVMYEMLMYKCKEDGVTGAWDASKWERTTAVEGSGGGADLDIYGEASGTAEASFSDGAEASLVECEIGIVPSQDLHGYSKPWAGGAGKNKLNVNINDYTTSGVTITNSNGVITLENTATANVTINLRTDRINISDIGNTYKLVDDGSFTFSSDIYLNIRYYDSNSSAISNQSMTSGKSMNLSVPSNAYSFMPMIIVKSGIATNGTVKPMLMLQTESSTTFEPYSNICPISGHTDVTVTVASTSGGSGEDTTVALGRTVYGGTLDVTTGELTVNKVALAINDIPMSYSNSRFNITKSNINAKTPLGEMICECYPVEALTDKYIDQSTSYIRIYDSDYTNVTDFKSAMGTYKLCYELDTPQIYTLTKEQIQTLLGQNYVSHDGGGTISLVYIKKDSTIIPNPAGAEIPLTGLEINGEKFKIAGGNSEIIPIPAGNDTTSRTFTFSKTPKFIKFYWDDTVIEGTGWVLDAQLVWGQSFMDYLAHARYTAITGGSGASAAISFGADGKSITITGGNAFGAMNTSNGTGLMFVEY